MPKTFELLQKHSNDSQIPLVYVPKFREYGIQVLDGGSSYILLKYCPFTGQELPDSLRNMWFDILEELELEPDSPELPEEFKTEEWWIKRRL